MNLTSILIDGALKLVQKVTYKGKENRLRIWNPRGVEPEKVLYESKTNPGIFLDEETDKMYIESNGKFVSL